MNTFFSYSFGCRVNEAEKEEIDRQMYKTGFIFEAKNPDIYIINTCSVTQKAEREARQMIFRVKKTLPNSKIVVTGCSATYWLKNNLQKTLPIDLLIDNVNKQFLVDLIKSRLLNKTKTKEPRLINLKQAVTNKFIGSGRIMIKIQDGCQRFCTYCIVPYLRGTPKSFKINEIVNKVNSLNNVNNIQEVILTAINTEAFGLDTKESLIGLLQNIINKTSIPRISLGSIHPWSVNDAFFKFYKKYLQKNRLVNFFHVPIQSGSNKILSLMKRGYTSEEMLQKLEKLRSLNEYSLIATDVIVGYFEENEADFKDTYNFLKKSPISKFHVFRYSKRDRTAGFYMAKRLKEPSSLIKTQRAKALIELSKKKYQAFMKKNLGRNTSILLLEKIIGNYQEGLTDNQLPIWIKKTSRKPGILVDVKIISYKRGQLFGKII